MSENLEIIIQMLLDEMRVTAERRIKDGSLILLEGRSIDYVIEYSAIMLLDKIINQIRKENEQSIIK